MDRKPSYPLILWLYDLLARLYPPALRARFAGEQRQVFEQALEEGDAAPARLLLRELAHLPGVLLRWHWRGFRGGGWRALLWGLALLLLFCLPAVEVLERLGLFSAPWVGYAFLTGLAAALLAGIALGFPRWSLPFAGSSLALLSLLIFNAVTVRILDRTLPRMDYSKLALAPRLLYSAFTDALMLFPWLLIVFALLILLRLLPRGLAARLPAGWKRPRRWSDVSFLLYGAVAFWMMIVFDEYTRNELPTLIAVGCMLGGAYGYMRARHTNQATGWLLGGATLAYVVIAVAKWLLVPLQTWNGWLADHPVETERWFESLSVLVFLGWSWLVLLLPSAWRALIEPGPAGSYSP